MPRITLKALDDHQKSVKIPVGKITLGRGPLLQCSDKKVSRSHAVLEVTNKGEVFLTPTHVNPCFYQPTADNSGKILKMNVPHKLNNGDSFSLLPRAFRYQVVVSEDENNQMRNGTAAYSLCNERKSKIGKRKIEEDYEELLSSGKNADMMIEVKGKKFKCHRCILGIRSPVFSVMMDHDMKEKNTGIVTIKDSEPTIFQEFLLYLYTGYVNNLNCETVADLYKLADKYDVADLKSMCQEYIKKNISVENCCKFFLLFQQHNDSEMSDLIINFFLKNTQDIIRKDKWLIFLSENPVESNILINSLSQEREKSELM